MQQRAQSCLKMRFFSCLLKLLMLKIIFLLKIEHQQIP